MFVGILATSLFCGYPRVKSVRIRCFSGPYFPAFGLNTEIYCKSLYSVQMRENTDQKNTECGHFLRSVCFGLPSVFYEGSLINQIRFALIFFVFLIQPKIASKLQNLCITITRQKEPEDVFYRKCVFKNI